MYHSYIYNYVCKFMIYMNIICALFSFMFLNTFLLHILVITIIDIIVPMP
jgi:hypothetical protein